MSAAAPEPDEQGQLESISAAQLLAEAWRDRRSGSLRLTRGQDETLIQVTDGAPTGVETNRPDDDFASALENAGPRISPREASSPSLPRLVEASGLKAMWPAL